MTFHASRFLGVAIALAVLAGCGGDATDEVDPSPIETASTAEPTPTATDTPTPTGSETTAVPSPSATESTPEPTTSPTVPVLEQPAVWPAPGVTFDDPSAAADDFVATVFGVPPNLGAFQQGDARSGEIEVLSPVETGGTAVRSVLLLRQLGPDDGWFVLAAVSPTNTIESPPSASEVPAGPVEVSGQGRGFEGALVVEAFPAGDGTLLDQAIAQGGSMEETEPYAVTLDLSAAAPGDTVLVLVRGGVGLETDTGEFSAIPLTIG